MISFCSGPNCPEASQVNTNGQWSIVRMDDAAMASLMKRSFMIPDSLVEHVQVIVDTAGQIRGYYALSERGQAEKVLEHLAIALPQLPKRSIHKEN